MKIIIESEVSEHMFTIYLTEAIMTNFLLREDVVLVTSYEDWFGQEILMYKVK